MSNNEHTPILPHMNASDSGNSTERNDLCEANVLISLIDGVETRMQCEYRWKEIYTTSQKQQKRLCAFHSAFMDFALEQDATGGAA